MMEGAVLVTDSLCPTGRMGHAGKDNHGVGSEPPLRMAATLELAPAALTRNENSFPGGWKVRLKVTWVRHRTSVTDRRTRLKLKQAVVRVIRVTF